MSYAKMNWESNLKWIYFRGFCEPSTQLLVHLPWEMDVLDKKSKSLEWFFLTNNVYVNTGLYIHIQICIADFIETWTI